MKHQEAKNEDFRNHVTNKSTNVVVFVNSNFDLSTEISKPFRSQSVIEQVEVQDEFEKEKAGSIISDNNPEFSTWSLFFKESPTKDSNWIENTNETAILVHAKDH
jgi:hypothetical protein